ncbi:MAG: HEAT repeat domain-containing protein [Desulfobulbaceae bacterium]|nr:HEAT repeat domain-containing protein [Desulfobulbaceae bacterium]
MGGRKAKSTVMQLLAGNDPDDIRSRLAEMDVREVLHALFSAICRSEEHIRWNAIACMGPVVARLADQDMEEARIVMRRLLWSLNDESGGIGWGAPEAMAEIMACHKGLAEEYIHMLVSYMREDGEELFQDGNFLEHEGLQRGLMWGMARLAAARPDMLVQRGAIGDLLLYLQSSDPAVRGLAARSLGLLGAEEAEERLHLLSRDDAAVRFFDDGAVRTARVADLASEAMDNITAGKIRG